MQGFFMACRAGLSAFSPRSVVPPCCGLTATIPHATSRKIMACFTEVEDAIPNVGGILRCSSLSDPDH